MVKSNKYPRVPGIGAPGYGIGTCIGKFYLNLMMKMKDESTNESTCTWSSTYMYESER
jgi:hypothetical protein